MVVTTTITSSIPGPKPRTNIFGFLDETGSIYGSNDVFGIGLLTLHHPSSLHRAIINFRNSRSFHNEFKFEKINPFNVSLYKDFVDLFFNQTNIRFSSVLYDQKKLDMDKYFKGDKDKAYNSFSARLIAKSLGTSDYIVVFADDIHTKKTDNFEKQIKDYIKRWTRRNALFGICKLESHAVSEIQLVDVMLGSVSYAYKMKLGINKPSRKSAKLKIVKHLQSKLNIDFLSQKVDLRMRNGIKFAVEEFFH